MMYNVVRLLWCVVMVMGAAEAWAQPPEPLAPLVLDVRGTLARFKEDAAIAQTIEVEPSNLPTRGLGVAVGAHWYPVRLRRIALGLGGEIAWARDSRSSEVTTGTTTTAGPTVTTRFSPISPHVSLNFGDRDGWSYISGGIGWARLTAERDDEPLAGSNERARMSHYGAGARWFTGPHIAFTFDLRFYAIDTVPASATRPAFPRSRMMVVSVGASFH